jgi:hypothetical protein
MRPVPRFPPDAIPHANCPRIPTVSPTPTIPHATCPRFHWTYFIHLLLLKSDGSCEATVWVEDDDDVDALDED